MDLEGRLLKDTITGLSTDTTLHYVQNESFKLNFMEFFAVSNTNPGILKWKRPLRYHPSEVQASRKQRITDYKSAIKARIQNQDPESNLDFLIISNFFPNCPQPTHSYPHLFHNGTPIGIKQHSEKTSCLTFSEGVKLGFNVDSVIECFIPQLTVHLRNDA
ncbi:unnamed protein product [Caenorhabditis brenneri]